MAFVLRRLALASLVANVTIVLTGGAVRLTGSGLGCPTWPRCTDGSYVTTAEMGVHGVIEFGNRMLGGVVGLLALACVIAAWRLDRRLVRLALLAFVGVAAQGLLGGIIVWTGLNPWIVAAHFLISMAILAAAYALWRRAGSVEAGVAVPRALRYLVALVAGTSAAVLAAGTIVTGSGPHSGDPGTGRNGFDPAVVTQVHADLVVLLVGLTVGLWFAARLVRATPLARAAGVLLLVELAQGGIGVVQHALHLPASCAVWLATLVVLSRTPVGRRPAAPPAVDDPSVAETGWRDPIDALAR